MPTALKTGPYRFYFYSNENNEPPHIHVKRDAQTAKYWLTPVGFADNDGFSPRELREIEALTREHCAVLLEKWNEHFGISG